MMIGYNSNEGLLALLADIGEIKANTTEIQYQYFVPHQMNLSVDSVLHKEIVEKFRKKYSADRPGEKFLVSTNNILSFRGKMF